MLRKKLVAFLGTFAFLAVMPMSASAVVIDFNLSGDQGAVAPSDTFVLDMRLNLAVGENPGNFNWSVFCTGCVITGYTDFHAQPAYFPTAVDWTGEGTNADFADPLFADMATSPFPPPSQALIGIGSLKTSGTFSGQGITKTVGFVTVHVTAASGSVIVEVDSATDGFFCGAPLCTWNPAFDTPLAGVSWVPEPGTAMLLALGLGGLGVMGRRGRK